MTQELSEINRHIEGLLEKLPTAARDRALEEAMAVRRSVIGHKTGQKTVENKFTINNAVTNAEAAAAGIQLDAARYAWIRKRVADGYEATLAMMWKCPNTGWHNIYNLDQAVDDLMKAELTAEQTGN